MRLLCRLTTRFIYHYRKPVEQALEKSHRFTAPIRIDEIAEKAERITSLGTQCGEGWILAGEMMEFVDQGIENIVCLQPFACLPNHVVGKGMIRPMRKFDPRSNIVAIDYDPGSSEVNQLNRIKLMMATAYKNLETESDARRQDDSDSSGGTPAYTAGSSAVSRAESGGIREAAITR